MLTSKATSVSESSPTAVEVLAEKKSKRQTRIKVQRTMRRTIGESVKTKGLGDALSRVEQERREDSVVDRSERNIGESEEKSSRDDVGLGGEERDVELSKVASLSSSDISSGNVSSSNRGLGSRNINLNSPS